jgi:hypothetical protein
MIVVCGTVKTANVDSGCAAWLGSVLAECNPWGPFATLAYHGFFVEG